MEVQTFHSQTFTPTVTPTPSPPNIASWQFPPDVSPSECASFTSKLYSRWAVIEILFYRAAWNADAVLRWDFCLSVRPSVRPSVCQTRAFWQNGRKICLDFYIIRKNIYPSFLKRRMVGEGRPLLPEILGQGAGGNVFKVRGQRSRLWLDQLTYSGAGRHFDGMASIYFDVVWPTQILVSH